MDIIKLGRELFEGITFKRFNHLSNEDKQTVIMKTAAVALAVLAVAMLVESIVITIAAVGVGALAFAHFTREAMPFETFIGDTAERVDSIFNQLDKIAKGKA